jgi:murein DD-endopeptidase MepM/ murein hydrolase activator NlpD
MKNRTILIALAALIAVSVICAGTLILAKRRSQVPISADLPSIPAPPPPLQPALKEVAVKIGKNQTITDVLIRQGFSKQEIHQMVEASKPVYDLAMVGANQPCWIYYTAEGEFNDFRYVIDDERYLTLYRDSQSGFVPEVKNFPYEARVEGVAGTIDGSLVASVLNCGEKEILALELANIFGSDIDFYTDLQKGDSYRILVEKKYLDGQFRKYGSILAADMVNQNKKFTGVRFEDEKGKPAYYAPDGKALERSFFKSPLKFAARISSRFSGRRLHPILKIVRPHLGVDYVAPAGTPVQAVGAGVVIAAGYSGANGKMIKLRHAGEYETMYLHLSRILVKVGSRVAKGDLIGYVGSTGLSTGAHLDFRVSYRGKFVNPTKVVFPPAAPVRTDSYARFSAQRDAMLQQLELVDRSTEVIAE